jgi:hypothetical protein
MNELTGSLIFCYYAWDNRKNKYTQTPAEIPTGHNRDKKSMLQMAYSPKEEHFGYKIKYANGYS